MASSFLLVDTQMERPPSSPSQRGPSSTLSLTPDVDAVAALAARIDAHGELSRTSSPADDVGPERPSTAPLISPAAGNTNPHADTPRGGGEGEAEAEAKAEHPPSSAVKMLLSQNSISDIRKEMIKENPLLEENYQLASDVAALKYEKADLEQQVRSLTARLTHHAKEEAKYKRLSSHLQHAHDSKSVSHDVLEGRAIRAEHAAVRFEAEARERAEQLRRAEEYSRSLEQELAAERRIKSKTERLLKLECDKSKEYYEINLELLDQLQRHETKENHARQTMAQIHELTHTAACRSAAGR